MTGSNEASMVLRSGKALGALEKYRKEFLEHCFGRVPYDETLDTDIHYSLGLGDPVLYEKAKVKEFDWGSDTENEEYENHHEENLLRKCKTEEERNFVRERRDLERRFDLAGVRNELRGYLVDSFFDGCINEEGLNYVAKWFNRLVDEIRFGPSIDEYRQLCKKKLTKVLFFASSDIDMTYKQTQDIEQRVNGLKGVGKNTFKRDKDKYFGANKLD